MYTSLSSGVVTPTTTVQAAGHARAAALVMHDKQLWRESGRDRVARVVVRENYSAEDLVPKTNKQQPSSGYF